MSVYIDSLVPSGYLKDKYTSQMKLTIKAAANTEQAYTGLMSYRGTTFKVKNYCGLSISEDVYKRQFLYRSKAILHLVSRYIQALFLYYSIENTLPS